MPLRIVNPGDLITAATWNDLAALVNNLEVRVAGLEKAGKGVLRITQVLPPGAIMAGDIIRISGSGFDYTRGAHSVYFGSTRATTFESDSSDSLLIVHVPDPVAGATPGGAPITMTVGNLTEFTTWPLTIKSKPEVTTGGFQFTYQGSQPATPTQNQSVFYDFELKSFASKDLMITITPNIQIVPPLPTGVSDPGLANLLAVIDSDGTVRANREVQLLEGTTKTIRLRLNLPDQTNGVKYSLSVTAGAAGVVPVVETLPQQQVGQAGEQPDATVTAFELSTSPFVAGQGSFSTDTGGVAGVDGTLTIAPGLATIEMRTQFSGIPLGTTNNYDVDASVDTPANGWSAGVNSATADPLPVAGPGGSTFTYFDITAPTVSATAVLRLTLTRQGATTGNTRKVAYRLVRR